MQHAEHKKSGRGHNLNQSIRLAFDQNRDLSYVELKGRQDANRYGRG